jgi:hypothetical protein
MAYCMLELQEVKRLIAIFWVLKTVLLKIWIFCIYNHVVGRVVADVSKHRSTVPFSCSGTTWHWKLRLYSPSKRRELHTQLHDVTIQNPWIVWKAACSRMLQESPLLLVCLISFQICENLAYYNKSGAARRTLVFLLAQSPLWNWRDVIPQHMLFEPIPSLFLRTKAKRSLTTKKSSYIRMNNRSVYFLRSDFQWSNGRPIPWHANYCRQLQKPVLWHARWGLRTAEFVPPDHMRNATAFRNQYTFTPIVLTTSLSSCT